MMSQTKAGYAHFLTEERLKRLRENATRLTGNLKKLSELWDESRRRLSEQYRVTTLFSNFQRWQFNAINHLVSGGFSSTVSPIFRAAVENALRMVYYEKYAPQEEKRILEMQPDRRAIYHEHLLRAERCLGRLKREKHFSADWFETVWTNYSSDTHGNVRFLHLPEGVKPFQHSLTWIALEIPLAPEDRTDDDCSRKVLYYTFLVLFLTHYWQLVRILIQHNSDVDDALKADGKLARQLKDLTREFQELRAQNNDLYTSSAGSE